MSLSPGLSRVAGLSRLAGRSCVPGLSALPGWRRGGRQAHRERFQDEAVAPGFDTNRVYSRGRAQRLADSWHRGRRRRRRTRRYLEPVEHEHQIAGSPTHLGRHLVRSVHREIEDVAEPFAVLHLLPAGAALVPGLESEIEALAVDAAGDRPSHARGLPGLPRQFPRGLHLGVSGLTTSSVKPHW